MSQWVLNMRIPARQIRAEGMHRERLKLCVPPCKPVKRRVWTGEGRLTFVFLAGSSLKRYKVVFFSPPGV